MITANKLSKKYDDRYIFENISLKIGQGKKIGLVGKNGCGKSTLFKLLNGIEEPTDGKFEIQGETLGYIPQEFNFSRQMVGEYLENCLEHQWDYYKIESLATQLKFHNFDPYQELHTLSEGQKMKVKLIEVLLNEPTVLFIDEPTNHLDIDGILWFEEYIRKLSASVIMISHDRSFLNNVVDEIWEIERNGIYFFPGSYDKYKEEKLKLINKWDEEYKLFMQKKAQLEKLLVSARKIKDGKKRGRAVQSAKKRIEREVVRNKKEKYSANKIKDFGFDTNAHQGKLMIRFDEVSKYYHDKEVFKDISFELRGKEKVWLFGPNGAGKSTLVKMITENEPLSSGNLSLGANIKVGYFSQTQMHFNPNMNLFDAFMDETRCFHGQVYGYLSKFMFSKDNLAKRIKQLSPGERSRFAFAVFAHNNYDLLILDEPDNHLDIETKEVIEKSLKNFDGAILLVSHDRYFVESIGVNKILNLSEGKLELIY